MEKKRGGRQTELMDPKGTGGPILNGSTSIANPTKHGAHLNVRQIDKSWALPQQSIANYHFMYHSFSHYIYIYIYRLKK